jgi:hypothetical protein
MPILTKTKNKRSVETLPGKFKQKRWMAPQNHAIQEGHTVSDTSSTIGGNRDIHAAETTGCASPGGWSPGVEEHDVQIGEQVTASRDPALPR